MNSLRPDAPNRCVSSVDLDIITHSEEHSMHTLNRSKRLAFIASSIFLGLACAAAIAGGRGGAGPGGRGFPGRGGAGAAPGPAPKALYPDIKPVLTAEQLKEIKIENTTIDSVTQAQDGSIRINAT